MIEWYDIQLCASRGISAAQYMRYNITRNVSILEKIDSESENYHVMKLFQT